MQEEKRMFKDMEWHRDMKNLVVEWTNKSEALILRMMIEWVWN